MMSIGKCVSNDMAYFLNCVPFVYSHALMITWQVCMVLECVGEKPQVYVCREAMGPLYRPTLTLQGMDSLLQDSDSAHMMY